MRRPYFGQILVNFQKRGHFSNNNFLGFTKITNIVIVGAMEASKWEKQSVQSNRGHPVGMGRSPPRYMAVLGHNNAYYSVIGISRGISLTINMKNFDHILTF